MADKPFLVATHEFGLIDHINALDKRIGHLEMLAGLEPNHEKFEQKSSGIDGDAGDWTSQGDGTGYPEYLDKPTSEPSGDTAVEIAGGDAQSQEEMRND